MGDFNLAFVKTDQSEGGWVNNSKDRGGETYRGISRKNFPRWAGWAIVDSHKGSRDFPKSLERLKELNDLVHAFYKHEFWDKMQLDRIKNQGISEKIYDIGVNMGFKVAITFLQKALNLTNRNGRDYKDIAEDGIIGPITISTMNNHKNPETIFKIMNVLQGNRYINIAENDQVQEAFINGWFNLRIVQHFPEYEIDKWDKLA